MAASPNACAGASATASIVSPNSIRGGADRQAAGRAAGL